MTWIVRGKIQLFQLGVICLDSYNNTVPELEKNVCLWHNWPIAKPLDYAGSSDLKLQSMGMKILLDVG